MSQLALHRSRLTAFGATATAGMALGVGAYALFSLHDASIKWLVTGIGMAPLPVWQVLFFRSVFIMASTVAAGRTAMLERAVRTPLKAKLLGRATITLIAWLCYYSAARALPLAQLLTLYFAAPIITTLLARPLLGERIPPSRWVSVLLGFAGVVVACDPRGFHLSRAALMVLLAAAFWGTAIILMRQIARRESSLLQMFYTNALFAVATGIACVATWTPVGWSQAGLLATICCCGGLGQFCLFEGARRAPASVMATVEYSALIWAFILGYVVFGDVPAAPVFAGAGLILLAGAWLLWSEWRGAHRLAA